MFLYVFSNQHRMSPQELQENGGLCVAPNDFSNSAFAMLRRVIHETWGSHLGKYRVNMKNPDFTRTIWWLR